MADGWDSGLYEMLKARRVDHLESQLKDFKFPVLVITGDDDRIVPTATLANLACYTRGEAKVILSKLRACSPGGMPTAFLDSIIPFIITIRK